ncbi:MULTISPECIES: hypothetical protein [Acidobacterium]|uniref:hypothetical protein n=1 Tax=Acidobacterium TaxID=33973 RepID=UPI0005A224DB|nr:MULTISPECIES: hypothetical protein [Acidobacterium]HCT60921.1 hypothetical protein [Acidobacterium sp.]
MEPIEMKDRRAEQGEKLKEKLTAQRHQQCGVEAWPWKHAFEREHNSALHEAGHAVLASAFGRQICQITVIRNKTGDGNVSREICTDTLKAAVEEILIKNAGYEAACLYGFETDDSCDVKDIEQLKERSDKLEATALKALDERKARECVRQALKDCRVALEDLAAALFTSATLTGEEVSRLIADKVPESVKENLAEAVDRLVQDSTADRCRQSGAAPVIHTARLPPRDPTTQSIAAESKPAT